MVTLLPRMPHGTSQRTRDRVRPAAGALWLGTHSVVVKAAHTVLLLVLAATLAPSSLGVVALGTLVTHVAVLVCGLGVAQALVHWRGDAERAARTAVTLVGGAGLGALVLLWWTAPLLTAVPGSHAQLVDVVRGLALTVPFVAVAGVTHELLRRRLLFLRRIVPEVVATVVGTAVAVHLALGGQGVLALVVGQLVQAVLVLLLAWAVHPPVLPGWDAATARALLGHGLPVSGTHVLEVAQLNIDYVVVAQLAGAAALGQYSLGFRVAHMPFVLLALVVCGAAFPVLCRRAGEDLGPAAERVVLVVLGLVAPACVLLALEAEALLVLGAQWLPAVEVLRLLAPLALGLGVVQAVQVALTAAGRPAVALRIRLAHLAVLVLLLPLAAVEGIAAVAVVQAVTALLAAAVATRVAGSLVPGFDVRRLLRGAVPVVLAASAMVPLVVLLDAVLPGTGGLVRSGALAVLGLVGFGAVLAGVTRDARPAARPAPRGRA